MEKLNELKKSYIDIENILRLSLMAVGESKKQRVNKTSMGPCSTGMILWS